MKDRKQGATFAANTNGLFERLSLIWDKAITTLLKEMSKGRTAPITYKMMK